MAKLSGSLEELQAQERYSRAVERVVQLSRALLQAGDSKQAGVLVSRIRVLLRVIDECRVYLPED